MAFWEKFWEMFSGAKSTCATCGDEIRIVGAPDVPSLVYHTDGKCNKSQKKWDIFFLGMAEYVSRKSKDPSTKTGAVIVRPDKSVCSVGFNGFPQKMPDTPEFYANREEKYSRVVHCEVNAQLFSRDGDLKGYTLYVWPFASCDRCCVQMLQAGITRFVWPEPDAEKLARWGAAFDRTKKYLQETGVPFTEVLLSEIKHE